MYEYISLAAGGTVTGAKLIIENKVDIAFNPSGGFHHAHRDMASGFCFINDIVLGAKTLRNAGFRVCILDVDVHHCDGVSEAFYDSDTVMTISMHEDGRTLFPGKGMVEEIGVDNGKGYTINIPLPVGTYNSIYYKAFSSAVYPLMCKFNPDVIIMELGMDTLQGDPLAHLHLTNEIFITILQDVMKLKKPILATGGGGYNIDNTVRSWVLLWSVLCDMYQEDVYMGMGGVMLENTDWIGGLRDRAYLIDGGQRAYIDAEVEKVIEKIKTTVFPIHGL